MIFTTQFKKSYVSLETRLLAQSTVWNFSEDQQKKIRRIVKRDINWIGFYQLAVKNRVYPVVYKNLKTMKEFIINEDILEKLENECERNRLYALLLTSELIRVTEGLKQQSIPVLLLKGPMLSKSIYQDVSMRVSRDLDLLTDEAHFIEADQYLTRMGYVKDSDQQRLSARQYKTFRKTFHHASYCKDNGVQLELHWRLSNTPFHITFEELWENRKKAVMFGRQLNLLSEEDNLIYLLIHGSMHAWKRLRWLCDIYEIVRTKKLDWDYIGIKIKKLKMRHILEQTRILLYRLFSYRLNFELDLSRGDKRLAGRLAHMALPFLDGLDGEPERYGHALYYEYKKYMLLWNKGINKKIHFLMSQFIPSAENFTERDLQDKYFFLYYLSRGFLIVKRSIGFAISKIWE